MYLVAELPCVKPVQKNVELLVVCLFDEAFQYCKNCLVFELVDLLLDRTVAGLFRHELDFYLGNFCGRFSWQLAVAFDRS